MKFYYVPIFFFFFKKIYMKLKRQNHLEDFFFLTGRNGN